MDGGISEICKPLIRSLLHVATADRLNAAEGSRQASMLLGRCALGVVLQETSGGYKPGALLRVDRALRSASGPTLAKARKPLEKQQRAYQSAIAAELYSALDSENIKLVRGLLAKYGVDKAFVPEPYGALQQHQKHLTTTMRTRLTQAAGQADESAIRAALTAAREYGETVHEAQQLALAALQDTDISQAALTFAYCGGNQRGVGTNVCYQQGQMPSTHAPAVCGEALDPSNGPVYWKATVVEHNDSDIILGVIGNPRPEDRSWTDPTVFSWGGCARPLLRTYSCDSLILIESCVTALSQVRSPKYSSRVQTRVASMGGLRMGGSAQKVTLRCSSSNNTSSP